MSQFSAPLRAPLPPRTSTPAVVVACAASLLLHAGLGLGLAKYRVPAPASAGDMDLGVEILLPAQGTGLPSRSDLAVPPANPAAQVSLAEAVTPASVSPPQTQPAPPQPPPPPPSPPEELVRLGTDDGVGVSDNMLGAAQATPHSASPGTVDQPALTLAPGAPGQPGAGEAQQSSDAREAGEGGAEGARGANPEDQPAGPPAEPAAPIEVTPAPPESPPAPSQAQPQPEPVREPQPATEVPPLAPVEAPAAPPAVVAPPAPSVFETQDEPTTDSLFELPQPTAVTVIDEMGTEPAKQAPAPASPLAVLAPAEIPAPPPEPIAPEPVPPPVPEAPLPEPAAPDPLREQARISLTPAPLQPVAPASSSAAPGTTGSPASAGGDSRLPGTASDAESTAVSTAQSLDFKPGMPLTGKGIRIRTVVPRFSTTTQLTTMPRNPVLVIRFNRAGRVVKAEFEKNEGTGYRDVDEPLLDAVYRWTAVGEQLSKLPADGKETIAFRIRYLLRDE